MLKKKKIFLFLISFFFLFGFCHISSAQEGELFFGEWDPQTLDLYYLNPLGQKWFFKNITGVNSYIDSTGIIEGMPGAEYLFFVVGKSTGFGDNYGVILRVETEGDPNFHPDEKRPEYRGEIAQRNFIKVGEPHYLGRYVAAEINSFYIDDTGIYYGAAKGRTEGDFWYPFSEIGPYPYIWGSGGIFHWKLSPLWEPVGWVKKQDSDEPIPAIYDENYSSNLAVPFAVRKKADGGLEWWAGMHKNYDIGVFEEEIYKWDELSSSWQYQFTLPESLGGYDNIDIGGLEIINNSLFVSTERISSLDNNNLIVHYRFDENGNVIDAPETPWKLYNNEYETDLDFFNLGFGVNNHFWLSGEVPALLPVIFEIGGMQYKNNPPSVEVPEAGLDNPTIENGCFFVRPNVFFRWIYNDPDDDPQSKYHIQVWPDSSVIYIIDHEKTENFQTPNQYATDLLDFRTYHHLGYNWRVAVWDSEGESSDYEERYFLMPYPYPWPNFEISSLNPEPEEAVNFINTSDCPPGCSCFYQWTFEDGNPSFFSGFNPPPVYFIVPGEKEVKLIVESTCGGTCTEIKIIRQQSPLIPPKWIEVAP